MKPNKKKKKTPSPDDLCQRVAFGLLVCEHPRSKHKPPKIHMRTKTMASSGGYTEEFVNLAPTHCTEFCSCIAFIEKDGTGEEKLLPFSARLKEENPFAKPMQITKSRKRDKMRTA